MIEVSCTEESSVLKTKLQDKNFQNEDYPHTCAHIYSCGIIF